MFASVPKRRNVSATCSTPFFGAQDSQKLVFREGLGNGGAFQTIRSDLVRDRKQVAAPVGVGEKVHHGSDPLIGLPSTYCRIEATFAELRLAGRRRLVRSIGLQ